MERGSEGGSTLSRFHRMGAYTLAERSRQALKLLTLLSDIVLEASDNDVKAHLVKSSKSYMSGPLFSQVDLAAST